MNVCNLFSHLFAPFRCGRSTVEKHRGKPIFVPFPPAAEEAPGGRFLRLPTRLPTQRRTKPGERWPKPRERLRTESAECRQQRGGDASMGVVEFVYTNKQMQ